MIKPRTSNYIHVNVKPLLTHWGRDKWTPFRRRHFQMHFLEWKCINFDQYFTEIFVMYYFSQIHLGKHLSQSSEDFSLTKKPVICLKYQTAGLFTGFLKYRFRKWLSTKFFRSLNSGWNFGHTEMGTHNLPWNMYMLLLIIEQLTTMENIQFKRSKQCNLDCFICCCFPIFPISWSARPIMIITVVF